MAAEDAGGSRASRSLFGPNVYGFAVLAMNAAFIVAGLAAVYLLYGLLSGAMAEFTALAKPERVRVLANIHLAQQALTYGLGIGSLLAAFVLASDEVTGYAMGLAAAAIGLGIPVAYDQFGGSADNYAMRLALGSFVTASKVPLGVAALLIVRDVVLRMATALQSKPVKKDTLTYGGAAEKESRPVRLNPLGKCWEGPYCREFVRVNCPIFHAKQACWRVKKGCYCEEDIVSAAAEKVSGVKLEMAPDPRYNFANAAMPASAAATRKPQLSMAQKKERCRHCIIYNEHQREKYQIMMPIALVGTGILCFVFSALLRDYLSMGLMGVEGLIARLSFFESKATASAVKIAKPSETVEWVLIGAFTLMVVSKVLQTLEWAIFKAKI